MKKFTLLMILGMELLIIVSCSPAMATPTINAQATATTTLSSVTATL